MQRWMLGPDVTDASGLVLEDMAMPEPGPGEVRVHAVSLNACDLMILAGPFGRILGRAVVPGSDIAGRIDKVGPGVDGWHVGDCVVDLHFRGWDSGPQRPGLKLGLGALDEDGGSSSSSCCRPTASRRCRQHSPTRRRRRCPAQRSPRGMRCTATTRSRRAPAC